ncbi:hypothetical protein [Primorskyibacter sp. 2E233]|uniref:hypothetical protein n=1 Tax=Primorskyibacter sp. 2E233 TaxID=3413431 RepID=UPI003BF3C99C
MNMTHRQAVCASRLRPLVFEAFKDVHGAFDFVSIADDSKWAEDYVRDALFDSYGDMREDILAEHGVTAEEAWGAALHVADELIQMAIALAEELEIAEADELDPAR